MKYKKIMEIYTSQNMFLKVLNKKHLNSSLNTERLP